MRRTRRRGEARRQLAAALEVFDRLGATPWSQRALAELGVGRDVQDDRYRLRLMRSQGEPVGLEHEPTLGWSVIELAVVLVSAANLG